MWAGGKGKLLKKYENIWPKNSFETYVEPFFGGGAVYCWLNNNRTISQKCIINDVNEEIMKMLLTIRNSPEQFMSEVDRILEDYFLADNRKQFYYDLREKYWNTPTSAMLFVLMRLGFNGIWQTCVKSKGLYGTPAGLLNHKNSDQIYTRNNVLDWAKALSHTDIQMGDYSSLSFKEENSLIYLDPPYRDSFTTYGTGFNDEEQKRLIEWCVEKWKNKATVLLANRCVENDDFFERLLPASTEFHYFDVTYTAGRRKHVENGFEAKKAREFLAVLR